MFRTVRYWWSEGSGQRTARLFVFEFVVVVAGVLVAQGLGDWAHDRGVDRQVTEENARIEYQIGRTQQYDKVLSVAAPCLRARITDLIEAVGTGRRYPDDYLTMPSSEIYMVEPVSLALALPMRDKYGAKRMEAFFAATATADNGRVTARDLNDQWTKFALLNPRYGTLESADRASLRAAGAQALRDLNRIELNAAMMDSIAKQLRIVPPALVKSDREQNVFPAHSCGDIWRTGAMSRATR